MSTTEKTSRLLKLRTSAEFQLVYKGGVKKNSPSFVVFLLANGLNYTRVGLTTPRKLGVAVLRNRVRRRIREILRQEWSAVPSGVDIVINPRRSAGERKFSELKTELMSLLENCR